jgi:hypothetical protein
MVVARRDREARGQVAWNCSLPERDIRSPCKHPAGCIATKLVADAELSSATSTRGRVVDLDQGRSGHSAIAERLDRQLTPSPTAWERELISGYRYPTRRNCEDNDAARNRTHIHLQDLNPSTEQLARDERAEHRTQVNKLTETLAGNDVAPRYNLPSRE